VSVSEVTQIKKEDWIASPQVLLAMTFKAIPQGKICQPACCFCPLLF